MIPKKEKVLERARELYVQQCYRSGTPELADISPESSELTEGGFTQQAKSILMRDQCRSQIESKDFYSDNFADFQFDSNEAMQTTCFISGSRGVGKSDIAMKISDQLMKEDILVVVFDPSTDWLKRGGIKEYLTVQPHSDLVVPNESIVFDISRLTPFEQQRMIENFSKKLFEFQLSSVKRFYVIFEECQTFFPLHAMQSKNFQNSMRLLCVGRNVSVSLCAVSQFPALVSKELIKNAQQIWIGCCAEPNTLAYWRGILGKKAEDLKTLQNGEFIYFNRNKISKIEIQPFENNIVKTRIALPEPQTLPIIEPRARTPDTSTTIAKLMIMGIFTILLLKAMML
jgi:hypothetical protein